MDLVTIAAFDMVPEAVMAKNLLESEGIPAFIDAEVASDMLHLTSETKLQVAAMDADQAREILAAVKNHKFTKEAAKEAEEHSHDKPDDA